MRARQVDRADRQGAADRAGKQADKGRGKQIGAADRARQGQAAGIGVINLLSKLALTIARHRVGLP